MPATDLVRFPGSTLRAHDNGDFIPVNGNNTFNVGLDPAQFERDPSGNVITTHIEINFMAVDGSGYTGVTMVTDIDSNGDITLNFATDGLTRLEVDDLF